MPVGRVADTRFVPGGGPIPCDGFTVVTRPDGTRAPWRTKLGPGELDTELRMIRAACHMYTAALILMRDSEIQEIERGALTTFYGSRR